MFYTEFIDCQLIHSYSCISGLMRLYTIKLFKSPKLCDPARSHTQPGGLMQYQSKVENWGFVIKIKFDVGTSCQV